jgi:hypothetical protein
MEPKSVKIYSISDVPRLRYIAGIILGDILGLTWEIVEDRRKLGKHPVINYSKEKIAGSFKIIPDDLLFETGVSNREINVSEWKGLPVFFPSGDTSDLPFDVFAASFYLVSRYEEYQFHETTDNGIYSASDSLACRNGFLNRPVIEHWSKELAKSLLKKFPTLTFKRNEFRSVVTFDIDEPFAYLGRNIFSSIGGLIRDIATNDGQAGARYRILVKEEHDPYEVFGYLDGRLEKFNADCRFFFPVGDHSKSEKNPSWKNEEYRKLIRDISKKYPHGMHPSFKASCDRKHLETEYSRLSSIVGSALNSSRFHSIRFRIPDSYISLESMGLKEDYSMGYKEIPGFRAGISRPFFFYDVLRDRQTNLKVIPFQFMDLHLNDDLSVSRDLIMSMISETRKAGGTLVSIWHNTFLLQGPEFQNRLELFDFLLQNQTS